MIELITSKEIFHCRLTGDPIVLDWRDTTVEQRQAARELLWKTGVIRLVRPDFFDADTSHQRDYAQAMYTHPLKLICHDYRSGKIYENGDTLGVTYGAYKSLNPGVDT